MQNSIIKLQGSMREFKSKHSPFEAEYHKQKQIWEADIRNWEIQPDAEIPWLFYIKDSDNVINQVTFLDCGCDDYQNLKINGCMHLSALMWRAKYTFKTNPKMDNSIYCSSEKEILLWRHKSKIYKLENINDFDTVIKAYPTTFITEGSKKRVVRWNDITVFAKEIEKRKQEIKTDNIANIFSEQNIKLYDYQTEAVIHMLIHKKCILALPMGYGKTISAIACIKKIEEEENRKLKVIVVCPTSLKIQWQKEINKYLKNKSVLICTGNKEVALEDKDFVIVNYESLYRVPNLLEQDYDLLILDEVQKIKNKETRSWKSVRSIKHKMCYALSGTVVENSVEDFIAIMEIIDEKSITPKWQFVNKFCIYENHKIFGLIQENVSELRKQYADYIIRCNIPKSLVPTGSIKEQKQDIFVTIDSDQKEKSDYYLEEAKKLLSKGRKNPLTFVEKALLNGYLTNSRMFANDMRLVDKSSTIVSAKTLEIAKCIEKHVLSGEKVVVFSQWIEYLKLIALELDQKSITYIHYNGSLNIKQKNTQLDKFQNDSSIMVFLSTDAGGVGLDGLQSVSHVLVHCEALWNPAKLAQRNGRLVRIGQKNNIVNIYNFMSKDTIEDQFILGNNSRKETIRENIIL